MLAENTLELHPNPTEIKLATGSIDLKYAEQIVRAYGETLLPTYEISIEIVDAAIWWEYEFVRIEYVFTEKNAYNPPNNWLIRVPFDFWIQKQAEIELNEYVESQALIAA